MEEYKACEICGAAAELHHIIFKSKAMYMKDIEINFKYLCSEHHRGVQGPHLNRKIDIKYKLELQKNLFKLFKNKHCWTSEEIRDKLKTTDKNVRSIIKTLDLYKDSQGIGYRTVDIVIRLMGGRLYAN